jgi:hypothetical protein
MALNYSAIRSENERRYGTDIDRIGKMLLVDRYDNRAHFIFELLQNAEDALARRGHWTGPRSVAFTLSNTGLRVSHFGAPFTEADVRGICGIAESTKDLTAIGRFGIGFKSVYAFTGRPEIHSGPEHFSVESYVWPIAIRPSDAQADETVFILPLEENDASARVEIAAGLQRLGPDALLFLRQIEEISWSVEGGASGRYLRSKPAFDGDAKNARQIVVSGQERDARDVVEETWLVFSRAVRTPKGGEAGFVEVAFKLAQDEENESLSVQPVDNSALVVFFPTVVSTHLGFLVQGPYRTTPSRDNIPREDQWNQYLVKQTATLLVDVLHSLRDKGLLDANALSTLPLDLTKFGKGQMFAPLFDAVREALSSERLLPCYGGGHVAGTNAKLARSNELRDLLPSPQLTALFQKAHSLWWLSEDITQDRTPELRHYLMRELGIAEIGPEAIPARLTEPFLEAQDDAWIQRLYEFLNGQPALLRDGRLSAIPLIRLEDGSHVAPKKGDQPQAFLPAATSTDFPTVRRKVCQSESARAFLKSLGLTVPDPVDDVIRNVLPKYSGEEVTVDDEGYEAHIRRILTAFGTDSKEQREKLLAALRERDFVIAVDAGDGSTWFKKPGDVYLATPRLKELFEGVSEVFLVDDAYSCFRGEDARELLEACGATRHLQSVPVGNRFSPQDLADMRTRAGAARSRGGDTVEDFTLRGLDQLLATLANLDPAQAEKKTILLWDALCDVVDRRGTSVFFGTYKWFYLQGWSCHFDAAFVQILNEIAWVPDRKGTLLPPRSVVFEDMGWKQNAFLLSKISFKPPIIEALAREAEIEPGGEESLGRHIRADAASL